ncbi:MAG TPA: head-tail connector protein [Azonexus sp.]|nr:head-tail connector protein [Azonexus sp.]
MPAVVIQRSAAAVLTLAEMKKHCRIDPDIVDDDDLLALIEQAAVTSAEKKVGGPLLTAECRDTFDAWPSLPWLHLGIAGGREVTSVVVIRDGQETPVPLTAFHVEPDDRLLCLKPRKGWPQIDDTPGAIRIDYRAGFGDSTDSLPADLRQWLRFRVATLYVYREEFAEGSLVELPASIVDGLIDHYRPNEVTL